MARLCVNIDHVATLRNARGGSDPEPLLAALLVELGGSVGVTVHLREDRRHIVERDVELIRRSIRGRLNLEMATAPDVVEFALRVRPDLVTLVPERREERTTEGGLDVIEGGEALRSTIARMREAGIVTSLFIAADPAQIRASRDAGADEIELHTGPYAHASSEAEVARELARLREGARLARELGLRVNAGHGLNYHNVGPVAAIPGMRELNIGHSIVARAVFDGLRKAVEDMARLVAEASAPGSGSGGAE